ncbi:MAG: 2-C-methyl-D-erythritol 4-phosphate cytidylyltransferase [Desulfotomaculaceae bacterium]
MGSTWAVVPAAGRSTRMGGEVNKQLLHLAGRPVIEYSLQALLAVPVAGVILVTAPGEEQCFARILGDLVPGNQIIIVAGGDSRRDSVRQGLKALPAGVSLVVVHDGARPLVKPGLIRAAIEEARRWGASTLAVPVKDTVKLAGPDNLVRETLPRELLWQVQTPQVFNLDILLEAHRAAAQDAFESTDDASLVERLGRPVKLVPGDYTNIKITTPDDILLAEKIRGSGLS